MSKAPEGFNDWLQDSDWDGRDPEVTVPILVAAYRAGLLKAAEIIFDYHGEMRCGNIRDAIRKAAGEE